MRWAEIFGGGGAGGGEGGGGGIGGALGGLGGGGGGGEGVVAAVELRAHSIPLARFQVLSRGSSDSFREHGRPKR